MMVRHDVGCDVRCELARTALPRCVHPDEERLDVRGVDAHGVVQQRHVGAIPERGVQPGDRLDDVTHLVDRDPGHLVARTVVAEVLEKHDGLARLGHDVGEVARRLRHIDEPGDVVEEGGLTLVHPCVDPDLTVRPDGMGELGHDRRRAVAGRPRRVREVEPDEDAQDPRTDGRDLEPGHSTIEVEVPAPAQHVREPLGGELLGHGRKRGGHRTN